MTERSALHVHPSEIRAMALGPLFLASGLAAMLLVGSGAAAGQEPPTASEVRTETGLSWQPHVDYDQAILRVVGKEGVVVEGSWDGSQPPALSLFDQEGQPLPDGAYHYELRLIGAPDEAASTEPSTVTDGDEATPRREVLVRSGSFRVLRGAIVPRGPARQRDPEVEGDRVSLTPKGRAELEPQDSFGEVVTDLLCVGGECSEPETYPIIDFTTARSMMKYIENRMVFQDTDNDPTDVWSTHSWAFIFNDGASGGADYFIIQDRGPDTASPEDRRPFRIDGGAPTDALRIGSTGRVGIGTATPGSDLTVVRPGNPITTFRMGGGDGGDEHRVTSASDQLRMGTVARTNQFRIFNGAPTSALVLSAGGVGVGTASPGADFDLHNITGSDRTIAAFNINGFTWRNTALDNGTFFFNRADTAAPEFRVRRADHAEATLVASGHVMGTSFKSTSSREMKTDFEEVEPVDVLAKLSALPVTSWRYMTENERVRHIGPVAEDFQRLLGLGDGKTISGIDANGVLMAAVQGLKQLLDAKEEEIAELRERMEALEASLGAPEP